jgi:hypothetical protein
MPRQNQWDTRSYPWQRRGEFLRSGWGPSIQSGTRVKGPTLWLTARLGLTLPGESLRYARAACLHMIVGGRTLLLLMVFAVFCGVFWDRIPLVLSRYRKGGSGRMRVLIWFTLSTIAVVLCLRGF